MDTPVVSTATSWSVSKNRISEETRLPTRFLETAHILRYAAPFDNEKALHHRIVDACQTIRNYAGIFERMRRSTMRRVEACIESHDGPFELL
jgi:hypothetical protein